MRKKIVFLVNNLDSGGLENYLLRFLTHYSRAIEAEVICKSGNKGKDLVSQFEVLGVTITPLKLGFFDLLQYFNLYKRLKKGSFIAICDFTGNFAALPLLMAKLAGIKKRVSFYRGSSNHFKEDTFRLLYNAALNRLIPYVSTAVLANSEAALEFFFGASWSKNHKYGVVYNGIDAERFLSTPENLRGELNIPQNAYVVGHVGRYNEAKNHKTIIEVALQLCKSHPDIYFILCGKDTDTAFQSLVNESGLDDQIKLLGVRDDVIKALNTMDCFYFPSYSEGQPNALIEAMLVGLPFVASDIMPNKETVPQEFYGQLVDCEDVTGAVGKILEIKNNPILRKELNISEQIKVIYNPNHLFRQFLERMV